MTLHGLSSFLQNNVLSLVLIGIGILVLIRSGRGDHKATMATAGIVLVGLALVGIAATGMAPGLGAKLASLLFG